MKKYWRQSWNCPVAFSTAWKNLYTCSVCAFKLDFIFPLSCQDSKFRNTFKNVWILELFALTSLIYMYLDGIYKNRVINVALKYSRILKINSLKYQFIPNVIFFGGPYKHIHFFCLNTATLNQFTISLEKLFFLYIKKEATSCVTKTKI